MGAWGASLLSFGNPDNFSEADVDAFLGLLHLFLLPEAAPRADTRVMGGPA